jgi:uncharacterized protein YegJ (DUF2314 family)
MLEWKKDDVTFGGCVLFRGSMPPRLENFSQLKAAGVSIEKVAAGPKGPDGSHWSADIAHPDWGFASVICLRDFMPVPLEVVKHDTSLTEEDCVLATSAGSMIGIRMTGSPANVLSDRKLLLRFLNLFMADDGLIAMDTTARRFWSRDSLREELQHDADLDVESLFVTHVVTEDEARGGKEPKLNWLHTHGLAELGALDFDILRPSVELMGRGFDTIRAIAYILLEKGTSAAGQELQVWNPGTPVTMVPVETFNRAASVADRALRDSDDVTHNENRVVLCDPPKKRLFGLGTTAASPAKMLSKMDDEQMLTCFPTAATRQMAERAQKTYSVFRAMIPEFAEFDAKAIVKLGYRIDGGEADELEHLWFEVHNAAPDFIDATLLNAPFNIKKMHEGQRAKHKIERLTDWMLMTPGGAINPRSMTVARRIRQNLPELRRMIAEHRNSQGE